MTTHVTNLEHLEHAVMQVEDGTCGDKKCCILVLCGLPAAGKSSLARIIHNKLSTEGLIGCHGFNAAQCNAILISYDELMPADLERRLIERFSNDQVNLVLDDQKA